MGEPKPPERRRHFRGKARSGRRVRLRYRPRGNAGEWRAAETRNIGTGGAFILGGSLPPGAEIDVQIDLPGREHSLALVAEVRWLTDGTRGDPAGNGIQFTEAEFDVLIELAQFLASLTGTEPEGVPAITDGAGE